MGRGTGWKDGKVIVSMMVVCAVLASLAFGVLVAYGICLALFRLIGGQTVRASARLIETKSVGAAASKL